MPVKPNLLERTAFFTLNAVPGTLLDLAGLFAFQAVSAANELSLFETLAKQAYSLQDLVDHLHLQERGLLTLLEALVALQYYLFIDGRVFAQEDLFQLANEADFTNIRFHGLQKLPGNSLMIAERA